jgi:hypothetical protein
MIVFAQTLTGCCNKLVSLSQQQWILLIHYNLFMKRNCQWFVLIHADTCIVLKILLTASVAVVSVARSFSELKLLK